MLPTQNANIDSWYYAACVNHSWELLNNHHLLYNIWGSIWFTFMQFAFPSCSAIAALNIMNAIAATAALMVFYYLLLQLKQKHSTAIYLSCLAGISFGFMRFATDAETYILPILFSLISTYYLLKSNTYINLSISAFFSILAVCTHQLHIWWTLALYVGVLTNTSVSKNAKIYFTGLLSTVLIIYFLASLIASDSGFTSYILGQYQKGNAGIDFSFKAILLTLINTVRTIFQYHGLIHFFVLKHFLISMIFIKRKQLILKKSRHKHPITKIFLLAIILHLTFAMLSSGNAEFMAMLPFLVIGYYASQYTITFNSSFSYVIAFTLIWNVYFGLLPYAIEDTNQNKLQVEYTIKHPKAYFYWQNKPLIENKINYFQGFYESYQFVSPNSIDSLLNLNAVIYTDFGNSSTTQSRESITKANGIQFDTSHVKMVKVDSFYNLYGKNYIYLVAKKNENFIFAP